MAIEASGKLEIGGDLVGSINDPIQKKVITYQELENSYKEESNSIKDRNQKDYLVLQIYPFILYIWQ